MACPYKFIPFRLISCENLLDPRIKKGDRCSSERGRLFVGGFNRRGGQLGSEVGFFLAGARRARAFLGAAGASGASAFGA